MTADVTAQAWAVVQAVGLGLAAGLLYDLFRVLRVRVHVPLLGPLLDLLFWITLTAVLFVWSQWAWGGMVRLYGAVFLFFGGCVYFWLLSSGVLWVGYRLADLVTFVLKILVLPLIALNQLRKKIKKLAKNIFLSGAKWGRINQITQEMERSARRRREREKTMRLKRTGILTKVVIVVLLVYLATSLLDLRGQIQSTKEQQQTVSQQVEDQRLANQELQEAIDNSDDPETLERVARERGYVKQGETLYSDVAG